MKYLLMLFTVLLISCGEDAPTPSELPPGANAEYFGKCVSNDEAKALGFSKKCSEPGCVCLQDVHGKEPRLDAHCHSEAKRCS